LDLIEKLYALINSLPLLASEIFLMLSFVLIVIVELILFRKKETNFGKIESQNWLWGFSLAIVLFVGYITVNQSSIIDLSLNQGTYFTIDVNSVFFKIIVIVSAVFLLFHLKILKYTLPNEFYPLLIFQILGLYLLAISTNFLLIYISIEIVSIASYIYAAINLNKKAAEASLKYALFGGISSAVMLYGISLMYGVTGTLDISNPSFAENLMQIEPIALSLIVLFTFGGFLFKISAFPFHLWVPDVYEATPTPIVSFMSVAPKAVGVLAITRLIAVLPDNQQNIVIIISIFSIAIGNFSALRQVNVKRMLAYSSIAQAGFIVAAIACISNLGVQSAYFYLFGYIFSNMLAFFLIDIVENKSNTTGYLLDSYKGLGTKSPIWGILIIISMVSLVGLPPTVGFSGKLFIFSAIWEAYQANHNPLILFLFVFGLFNTVISLYYYLRLPFFAFFRKSPKNEPFTFTNNQIIFAIALAIPVLFYFFKADLLMNWIGEIVK
jgi:NADH-quinone oxidoreductase subunit N